VRWERCGEPREPQRQTCKVCGAADKFDFHVPDDLWAAIVPPPYRNRVVCLYCFDEFAAERGVDYSRAVAELCFAGRKASFVFEARFAKNL